MNPNQLLINDRPLVVLPALVQLVGLERALILQQVHFLCSLPEGGTVIGGRKYTYQTYEEWRDKYFPFWGTANLRKHITELQNEGYLIAIKPLAPKGNHTKFYRVNVELLRDSLPKKEGATRVAGEGATEVAGGCYSSSTSILTEIPNREKEKKGAPSATDSTADDVAEVFALWLDVMGKNANTKLTANRRRAVRARLKEGYSVDQLKRAVRGCAMSPFHMGDNDSKKQYNDLTLICRNGEKVESFEEDYERGKKRQTNAVNERFAERSSEDVLASIGAD